MLLGKNFQLYNKVVFSRFPISLLLISVIGAREKDRREHWKPGKCLCDKLISGGGQERTHFFPCNIDSGKLWLLHFLL